MTAEQFITKVWFPLGVLAVLVAFVLEFGGDDHIGDPAVAWIVGVPIVGLLVAWGLLRRAKR